MTRDEVMKLTDEELRIKTAELAGWTRQERTGRVEPSWAHATGGDKPGLTFAMNVSELPDYLHDATVALELWRQMPEPKEIWWGLGVIIVSWDRDNKDADWPHCIESKSEELPYLITRAFVLAFDEKNVPS